MNAVRLDGGGQDMKIYMAALFHGRLARAETSASTHTQIIWQARHYPYALESFHYMNEQIKRVVRQCDRSIFLDSGAFSAFSQGAVIDRDAYAKEVIKHHTDTGDGLVHVASNLDAIAPDGTGAEQSYDNQVYLRKQGARVQPVHHVRDADHWLRRYLDEGYDYIFLGGMVPETAPVLRKWLDHVWTTYLIHSDGTPKVKVHGFGLTSVDLMFRYPWHSVDSTSWVMEAQFGSIYLDVPQWDGTVRDYKINFSPRSMRRFKKNSWHYTTLSPGQREVVDRRLAELEAERIKEPVREAYLEMLTGYKHGFNPRCLAEHYTWRDYANIEYFRRAMKRGRARQRA
jgi:hypothetical protein